MRLLKTRAASAYAARVSYPLPSGAKRAPFGDRSSKRRRWGRAGAAEPARPGVSLVALTSAQARAILGWKPRRAPEDGSVYLDPLSPRPWRNCARPKAPEMPGGCCALRLRAAQPRMCARSASSSAWPASTSISICACHLPSTAVILTLKGGRPVPPPTPPPQRASLPVRVPGAQRQDIADVIPPWVAARCRCLPRWAVARA